MSNYIVSKAPEMYGGKQADWLNQSARLVEGTTQRFRKALDDGDNLLDLFHETITTLGEERKRIAQEHKTENANLFGHLRIHPPIQHLFSLTPLSHAYADYRPRVAQMIQEDLSDIIEDNDTFMTDEYFTEFDPINGKTSMISYSLFNSTNSKKWFIKKNDETVYREICARCGIPVKENLQGLDLITEFSTDLEKAQLLHEHTPEYYNRIKLTSIFVKILNHDYPIPTDWILASRTTQKEGKTLAQTDYLVWLPLDRDGTIIDAIENEAPVFIIHQDRFLIEQSLSEIAAIFKRAIEHDPSDRDGLIQIVGEFQYLFADAMPYCRGSAAISEIFERAIFRCHGYELEYQESKMVNLEALTLDEQAFLEEYPQMITLSLTNPSAGPQHPQPQQTVEPVRPIALQPVAPHAVSTHGSSSLDGRQAIPLLRGSLRVQNNGTTQSAFSSFPG